MKRDACCHKTVMMRCADCPYEEVQSNGAAEMRRPEPLPGSIGTILEPWILKDMPAPELPQTMPSNPKQAYGDTKVPLHLFPYTAIAGGSLALLEGMLKYGDCNFRAAPVEAMTYVAACDRHMKAWSEGRDIDPDSGLDELFKALACIAILIDAKYAGSLIDNRKFPGGYQKMMDELSPHVERLRNMHSDKSPKHYTIKDAA